MVSKRRALFLAVLIFLLGGSSAALVMWTQTTPRIDQLDDVPRVATWFEFELPPGQLLVATQSQAGGPGQYPPLAFSRNGRRFVYAAASDGETSHLYLKDLDRFGAQRIAGTENAELPFFSPDGAWIGFLRGNTVFRTSLAGGNPIAISDIRGSARGATWGADDQIVLGGSNKGLVGLHAQDGNPVELTRPNSERGEQYHAWPEMLPDGEHILFTAVTGFGSDVGVFSIASGEWRIIERTSGAAQPRYLESGHLVFFRNGGLFVAPFSLASMTVSSSETPVLKNVFTGWNAGLDLGYFALSRTGSLVYASGNAATNQLVIVDRSGKAVPIPAERGRFGYGPSISPDGKRLAIGNRTRGSTDLWIYEIDSKRRVRLTAEDANIFPLWTADGKRLIYALFATGMSSFDLYSIRTDGGSPEPFLEKEYGLIPSSLSQNGELLAFTSGGDIYLMSLNDDNEPNVFLATRANEGQASFSPDSRFLAYVSDASGRNEIYVREITTGVTIPVSTEGGQWPRWSPDGNELFYLNARVMMTVAVQVSPKIQAGEPQVLFEGNYEPWYDVMPEGNRFVMIEREPVILTRLGLALNWSAEFD